MGFLRLRYSVPINVGANQSYKFPIEYICDALDVESFSIEKYFKNCIKGRALHSRWSQFSIFCKKAFSVQFQSEVKYGPIVFWEKHPSMHSWQQRISLRFLEKKIRKFSIKCGDNINIGIVFWTKTGQTVEYSKRDKFWHKMGWGTFSENKSFVSR